jgi:hypothetical protein
MVFVRGTNGAIYTKSSTDGGATWSTNWGNIGGQALDGTGPAASRWGSDGYAIFVTGTNHQVYLKSWTSTGGWVDWRSIGGYVTSSPGAARGDALHVEVLARGSNGNCYLTSTGNGGTTWTGWMNFGGVLLAGTGPGIIWVTAFVTGTNHQLYWYVISSSWTPLGGYLTSGPGVAQRSSTAWDVFVRGKDGSIYWMAFFDNDWHDWIRLSGPP